MRQQFSNLDTWRGKLTATWVCLAPPAALVALFVAGGVPSNQFVVDAHALSQPRQDSVFDALAGDVPTQPGVDGRIGTEKRSQIGVPVTGTTDAKPPTVTPSTGGDASGIPSTVLAAYQRAATDLATTQPGCGITWPLLAGIGKVESGHASGGRVDSTGLTRGPILGPVLDGGPGMAAISDTDQGRYDGNTSWDRAVGPMQFIPGTWAVFGADGNGDGVKDPHNVFDATLAAGEYLCSGGADLRSPLGLVQAVLRYNHSMDYVSTVLGWMQTYSNSTVTLPDINGVVPPPTGDNGNVERDDDPTHVPVTGDGQTPDPTTTAPTQSTRPTAPVSTPTPSPTHTLPAKPPTKTMPPWTPPKTLSPTKKPSTPPTPSENTPPVTTPTPTRTALTTTPRTTPSTPPRTSTPTPPETTSPSTPPTTTPTTLPPCTTPEPTQAPTPTCTPPSPGAPSIADSPQPAS
jgi:membrane-bound lytic murein transglycosylase B